MAAAVCTGEMRGRGDVHDQSMWATTPSGNHISETCISDIYITIHNGGKFIIKVATKSFYGLGSGGGSPHHEELS